MTLQKFIDHNSRCDVHWVDGKPTWKRPIRKSGTLRICSNCFDRLGPSLGPMMSWPGYYSVEKDGDVDDA